MTSLAVFVAQFALVFLLGFQSRCVRDSNYLFAMGNSVLLGICGLVITPAIADPELLRSSPMVLVAYLSAGPLAIGLAIWVHDAHFVQKDRWESDQCCGCERCTRDRDPDGWRSRMITCQQCGNKRCPHATDHRNPCTGINEPGQPGSSFERRIRE